MLKKKKKDMAPLSDAWIDCSWVLQRLLYVLDAEALLVFGHAISERVLPLLKRIHK
jgi:uracil-DNA glycosylase